MNIRTMQQQDIRSVLIIDSAAFEKAWNEKEFNDELKKDYSYYAIIEKNGNPAGYAGIWCIYETAELIRIAVHPDYQCKGAASELMRHITEYAAAQNCEKMMLEVRSSNAPAQALYKKHAFDEIAVRKGYYDGEDAVIMERKLN